MLFIRQIKGDYSHEITEKPKSLNMFPHYFSSVSVFCWIKMGWPKLFDNKIGAKILLTIIGNEGLSQKELLEKLEIPITQRGTFWERYLKKLSDKEIIKVKPPELGDRRKRCYYPNYSGIIKYVCKNILKETYLQQHTTNELPPILSLGLGPFKLSISGEKYLRFKTTNEPEFLLESYLWSIIYNTNDLLKKDFHYVKEEYQNMTLNKLFISFVVGVGHFVYMHQKKTMKMSDFAFATLCLLYYQKNRLSLFERFSLYNMEHYIKRVSSSSNSQ